MVPNQLRLSAAVSGAGREEGREGRRQERTGLGGGRGLYGGGGGAGGGARPCLWGEGAEPTIPCGGRAAGGPRPVPRGRPRAAPVAAGGVWRAPASQQAGAGPGGSRGTAAASEVMSDPRGPVFGVFFLRVAPQSCNRRCRGLLCYLPFSPASPFIVLEL